MKNSILFLVLFLITSTVTYSQRNFIFYESNAVTVVDLSNKEEKVFPVDLIITIGDEYTRLSTGKEFRYISKSYKNNEYTFYVFAYDTGLNIKCRIWVNITSTKNANVAIEYGDVAFIYHCKLIKILN